MIREGRRGRGKYVIRSGDYDDCNATRLCGAAVRPGRNGDDTGIDKRKSRLVIQGHLLRCLRTIANDLIDVTSEGDVERRIDGTERRNVDGS